MHPANSCIKSCIFLSLTSKTNARTSQIKIFTTQGGSAHGKRSLHSGKHYHFFNTKWKFLVVGLRHGKLIGGLGATFTKSLWTKWCYSSPPLSPSFIIITISYSPVHAQIKFQGRPIERCWRDRIGPCQDSHHSVIFIDVKPLCSAWIP